MQTQIQSDAGAWALDSETNGNRADGQVNIGQGERWASALGGAALATLGLGRGQFAGLGLAAAGLALLHRGVSGHCYLYNLLGLNTSARQHPPQVSVPAGAGVRVEICFAIARSAEELYGFWRHSENLPRIMTHIESVTPTGPGRSQWFAKGPAGVRVSWEAEIYNEEPNRLIAWRSLPGSQIDTAGSVHFEPTPADRGTYMRVNLKYDLPAGKAGTALARLFGAAPEQEIREDLRRFKRIMEAGENATTEGQISCRG